MATNAYCRLCDRIPYYVHSKCEDTFTKCADSVDSKIRFWLIKFLPEISAKLRRNTSVERKNVYNVTSVIHSCALYFM